MHNFIKEKLDLNIEENMRQSTRRKTKSEKNLRETVENVWVQKSTIRNSRKTIA